MCRTPYFWTVQVKIGTVKDTNKTKSDEILGQYMMTFSTKKLNFGYEQVEIETVLDNFRTVQVKYRTVQYNNLTKSCENFGQYMRIFQTNKVVM